MRGGGKYLFWDYPYMAELFCLELTSLYELADLGITVVV
jgi:hypothetical protein